MTRLIVMVSLAAVLFSCRVVSDHARERTLMYWPHMDGAPVHVDKGDF